MRPIWRHAMIGHTYSPQRTPCLTRRAWRLLSGDPDRYKLHAHHKRKAGPHTTFVLTLSGTVALGWLVYDASTKAQVSSQWVEHTHHVLGVIGDTEDQLTRADAAMRAYAVSGNPTFLAERDAALSALDERIAELARLFAGDAPQRARVDAVRERVQKRVALMGETVKQYESGGLTAIAGMLRPAQQASLAVMDETREIERVEQSHLEQRRQQENARHRRTTTLLAVSALFALLVFVPMYLAFILQSRARAQIERRLYDMADGV